MREAVFRRLNQERWQHYETTAVPTDADELATRFVALTDDLAYAQTFYPHSDTTLYLNQLASRQHQALYKNKVEERGRFARLWAVEIPLVVGRHRRELRWALLVFVLSGLVGALSAACDDTFVRVVLGDDYVNQTLASIRRGDPMAVYKQSAELPMFLSITTHNIQLALLTFALGITGGIGTAFMLFRNGLMLGAFQYFFFQQKVLLASLLTIWIHGTLEISSLVLAGGAGFVLARGLLFPGTYARRESLRLAARESLKLALGIVPLLGIAGFLESFVTRHTEMPLAASLLIISGSAAFIGWYFVYRPRQLRQRLQAT
ncbi:stage II sporulation protein M [Hymenobacter baengnokdamensis]|uniref:stage II sporulation protein M n=1 Tax=Hymenobacter baengnokdamensis TaxID=2615203 RepID=UPI00124729DB|nr:stage II sporulation protein M [Hymenobacter baengnokdamensis]